MGIKSQINLYPCQVYVNQNSAVPCESVITPEGCRQDCDGGFFGCAIRVRAILGFQVH